MRREFALAAALAAGPAFAQVFGDWNEGTVPLAPPLRTEALVPLDIQGSDLRFGIDPASVSVGKDEVVRFVIVATSPSGTVNAFYQGVHCARATYRLYARHSPAQGWRAVEAEWKALNEGLEGRFGYLAARAGVCSGRVPGGTPAQIVQALRTPSDRKTGF
ncbi:CNP1-like family protein [Ramlibacter sp. PS4R-6]|uniref:CNP1-like family protein n=1 Tax=Ramlibacter sp. PS4R-6 TaxID=3133438 RepID=UPI0030B74DD8